MLPEIRVWLVTRVKKKKKDSHCAQIEFSLQDILVLLLNIKNAVFVTKPLQLSSTHLGACHSRIISDLITRESGLFRSGLRSWLECR